MLYYGESLRHVEHLLSQIEDVAKHINYSTQHIITNRLHLMKRHALIQIEEACRTVDNAAALINELHYVQSIMQLECETRLGIVMDNLTNCKNTLLQM